MFEGIQCQLVVAVLLLEQSFCLEKGQGKILFRPGQLELVGLATVGGPSWAIEITIMVVNLLMCDLLPLIVRLSFVEVFYPAIAVLSRYCSSSLSTAS